ncbi:hypothetical protein [Pseudopontixanthobacter vadosimaris]|uniref:hypothetical protein n=1 Tax=Pseudopontixanthobacter vadosimaris TaxID=2726450 RepID=UPI0014739BBB|nr:hypothetical protein [Pseudopontixanthobacter vadosimaris]
MDDTLSTSFKIRSAVIPLVMSRDQASDHVAHLVLLDATVIIRASRMPRGLVRHLAGGKPMPSPTDAQVLAELRPDLDVRPISMPEKALDTVTEYFGLHRANKADFLAERARRAQEEAQALYLAHLFTAAAGHERVRLAAAYQAWSALRKAAPLGAFGSAEEF